ncbi:MAG: hypothetical protein K0Q85_39 [Caproiciproducens sp.]|jgi:serine O-acetyltransferase|nr:hypothetical protein [Caproiciproducens sp.]
MKKTIVKIICYINLIRAIPALVTYQLTSQKDLIDKDIVVWSKYNNISEFGVREKIIWLLVFRKEYRNLFYKRIQKQNWILSKMLTVFFAPLDSLFIETNDIGAGLYIQHGFGTVIAANKIGDNCWINQQVTIGFKNKTDSPIIGNNVRITAGAVVIGKVNIGENSVIGANSSVTKDIPPNCTVVGNPGYIVKKNGIKVKEYL